MKITKIGIVAILLLFTGSIQSQQFENVPVNHIVKGEKNMWGGNALAVYDNNVYVVWQETAENSHISYVSKSIDGGATFHDGVKIDGDSPQYFASIAVGDAGTVYVAWTGVDESTQMPSGVYFAKSTDQAAAFSEPVTLSSTGAFLKFAVYNDHVYVFYMNIKGEGEFGFFLTRSVDGGTTFQPPVEVTDVTISSARFEDMNDMFVDDNGVIYCVWNDGRKGTGSDIYFALSTDNGQTFGENIPVHAVIDGDEKERFGASIAVYGSHVYIAWREEGENENILITKSTDGGASFYEEKTIVENSSRTPSITVNSQGDIYIVYPHFDPYPNYPEDYKQGVFITASNDQGNTFPVHLFISDQNANAKHPSTYVDANDVLHILWADERAGQTDIYFARGTIPIEGTAAPFALLGPPDGTHLILTDPEIMFRLEWEDVLELGDNDNNFDDNTSVYYHFRAALDAEFESGLGDDYFLRSYEEFRAGELGHIFALLQYHTGEVPDNVRIYWTIGAVNEWGTTWSSDTLHMSFEIDNNPPSDAVQLLAPADGTVLEVDFNDGTYTSIGGDITFSWNPTTDPDGDIVYYHWMMSNQFPLPDFYKDEFGDRKDRDYVMYIFPSGEFDADAEWDQGGVDTYLTIPPDVVFHWFLWGQIEEKTFYWTVIASDRFGMYHWVPGADTLQVTFRSTFTNVKELQTDVPTEFNLAQNYPNPFNPETAIRFALPAISDVRLEIFNLIGQRITTLIDGEQYGAGTYEVVWDGRDSSGRVVPSGTYIYSITTGEHTKQQKMILLK
jgi:hypothetical protein